ncbi:MAG TPA: glycine--tRNA ligase subunit beta [Polyangiaceae bacterium]
MAEDLLLEIGVEELPATFVARAIDALPELLGRRMKELRLAHGTLRAYGTPRRLAVVAERVSERQPDLDEQVVGPPSRVAFDAEGRPTKAAESFAAKVGCGLEAIERIQTDKGEYVAARRRAEGRSARELLPAALEQLCAEVPFQKAMRWGDGDTAFGRPIRWLLGLLGETPLNFAFAGVRSAATTMGHRFLAPRTITIARPATYLSTLREQHVLADGNERQRVMLERLHEAARAAGGVLIEDEFLVAENSSLVEEPYVIAGGFEAEYLALPERVILQVAKGHQRYFGVRSEQGVLLPVYLAVVNTALKPENIRRGNDRVMRARLADAKFFYDEDLKTPLAGRRPALDGIVFQKKLGSIGDKVARIERLVPALAQELALSQEVSERAQAGARVAKADLVTLMVGEFPELQGEMGRAYARAQGIAEGVADVISEHYQPRGTDDATAPSDAGALVAIADRLDTLAGCFGIGLMPTGAADPLALRRAAIGLLRTLLDKSWGLSLSRAVRAAHAGFPPGKLDFDENATVDKLMGFLRARLRGILSDSLPGDVVDACLASAADRPLDVARRARALAAIVPEVRALAGEVFKRAANIAKEAPEGEPEDPSHLQAEVHASEKKLFVSFAELRQTLSTSISDGNYEPALRAIADFSPVLEQFFNDVFVMVEDANLRANRLRLMRSIHSTCSKLANFNLLAKRGDA